MLLKVGIFIFLLLLPGEESLLPDLGSLFKKDSPLTPKLVKVHTLTQPVSLCEERIMDRKLGLVVFELENDPGRILTDYLISSLSKRNRFRLLSLQRIPLELPPPDQPSPLEKLSFIESLPEAISLSKMAERIKADFAVMGRVVQEGERMKVHLRLVDLSNEQILLAEVLEGDQDEILREMNAFIQEIHDRFPLLDGEVIFVRGNRINVTLGQFDGAKEGMELIVYRVLGLERIPDRGWIIGIQTQDIGKVRVSRVSEFTSEAEILELLPLVEIQRGDKVVTR
ncbi:TPA: hypothetical protein DCX15_03950 [bacterium]|nr:hypothetical protein [bacterium]